MFSEGVSDRSSPHNRHPVFHVVANDNGQWRTYCGYGPAREESPGQYPLPWKLCGKCKALAHERIEEGDMDPAEARHFAPEDAEAWS